MEARKQMQTSAIAIILVIISTIIDATGGLSFKRASKKLRFNLKSIISNYAIFVGFFLFGLSAIIYLAALTKGEHTVLYPLTALTYIWSSLLAKHHLHEKLNYYKWGGMALIVLGALLLTR